MLYCCVELKEKVFQYQKLIVSYDEVIDKIITLYQVFGLYFGSCLNTVRKFIKHFHDSISSKYEWIAYPISNLMFKITNLPPLQWG